MTETVLGFGIEVRVGATSAATAATVQLEGLKSIQIPQIKKEIKEVTSHSSVGGFREFRIGMFEGGDGEMDFYEVPGSSQSVFLDDLQSSQEDWAFEVRYTQVTPNRVYTFRALPVETPTDSPIDDSVTRKLSLKTTGPITIEFAA